MISIKWIVVSNGVKFRLRHSTTGAFYTEDSPGWPYPIYMPKEWNSKKEAQAFARSVSWEEVQ